MTKIIQSINMKLDIEKFRLLEFSNFIEAQLIDNKHGVYHSQILCHIMPEESRQNMTYHIYFTALRRICQQFFSTSMPNLPIISLNNCI